VNGNEVSDYQLLKNPYRTGGYSIDAGLFNTMLAHDANTVEVFL